MPLGWRPEGNNGSWQHGEGGDRDANMTQGHIQLVSELGMRAGSHTTTVEQLNSVSMQYDGYRLKRKRVGILRPPVTDKVAWVTQGVQSACDGHVTSDGAQIPRAIGVCSDQGSGHPSGM